jgi:hypothetical protein
MLTRKLQTYGVPHTPKNINTKQTQSWLDGFVDIGPLYIFPLKNASLSGWNESDQAFRGHQWVHNSHMKS